MFIEIEKNLINVNHIECIRFSEESNKTCLYIAKKDLCYAFKGNIISNIKQQLKSFNMLSR